ncbi:MAG: hypothetical protein ACRC2K_07220 [Clostridium sp.]
MDIKNKARNKMKKEYAKQQIKREQNFYKSMVTSKDGEDVFALFNERNLVKVILLVTVFLQLVSLATTFKGSKVYFGGIKLPLGISAPFLFAFAIQLIVFYVSNSLRANFKKWLVVVLTLATLCSTYFSYIGIYNYINSPINYLEERYNQIYENLTDKYNIQREEFRNSMKEGVFNLTNTISSKHTELTKKIEKNKELQKKIDGIKVKSGTISAQTGGIKKPNINDYNGDTSRYYSDMAKYNAAIGSMVNEANKQDSDLKNSLYENEVKAILGGKTLDEFNKESINDETLKTQIEKVVNEGYLLITQEPKDISIIDKISAIQTYCQGFIINSSGKSDDFTTLLSSLNSLSMQMGNKDEGEAFQKNLNQFVVINEKKDKIMKDLTFLEGEVYKESYGTDIGESSLSEDDGMLLYSKMQVEIKNAAYLLNNIGNENIDINDDKYLIHNLYVLPVTNLILDNEARQMAWFCLAFAILVDGLSLIFALTNGKRKTPLFARKNADVIGKSEEAMEEVLLLSILEPGLRCSEEELVDITRIRLEKFIAKFSLITEEVGNGYSMWASIKELKEYEVFIATLCQLNFGAIIKREDVIEGEEGSENYLVLRTKFIFWANDKISTLTKNKAYMERVQGLGDGYIEGGEII